MLHAPEPDRCQVVELRQYTLHPGQRDTLVTLFEREFVHTQQAAGIAVLGRFHDLDDPDRFVWWRGFADLPSRAPALQAFYGGPAWQAHREAANATMIDSDDVLLLRRLDGFEPPGAPAGVTLVTLCSLPPGTEAAFVGFFADTLAPALRGIGAQPFGVFVTEPGPNHFPRLPVREGENLVLWCTHFASRDGCARHEHERGALPAWQRVLQQSQSPPHLLRLTPTPGSLTQP
jgi:hypothetical protein